MFIIFISHKNIVIRILPHFYPDIFLFFSYYIYFLCLLFIDRLLEKEKVVIEEVKDEALDCAKERERVLQTKLDQLHTETTQKGD